MICRRAAPGAERPVESGSPSQPGSKRSKVRAACDPLNTFDCPNFFSSLTVLDHVVTCPPAWDCFSTTRLQCTVKDFSAISLRHRNRGAATGVRETPAPPTMLRRKKRHARLISPIFRTPHSLSIISSKRGRAKKKFPTKGDAAALNMRTWERKGTPKRSF